MKIYNTLTRRKEDFKTVNDKIVNMYVCGPTVYDLFHVGNARTFVFFDVVRNYLEYKGYSVKFIQNFTDIDDKIIKKANDENKTIYEISNKYIEEYYEDANNLNIRKASLNPKATDNVHDMINFIVELIENGFAYVVDGDVYFSIESFKEYGKLFGQDLDTLKTGARIEVNKKKKNPFDFILWKNAKDGEESYECPWGKGRPGWHTECSAMVRKYFGGETIDIHGGGFDLIFPHHENEIAQTEALQKKPLANYWIHCSFLNIENKKMSKSIGNFFTTRDILNDYGSNVLRFFILSSHYRNELCFSEEQLIWAKKSLDRIYKVYDILSTKKDFSIQDIILDINIYRNKFVDRLDDDFNTSDAISVMFEFCKFINSNLEKLSESDCKKFKILFDELFNILGIIVNSKQQEKVLDDKIKDLVMKRYNAKKNREFSLADSIRSELLNMGIFLEDISGGVRVGTVNDNKILEVINY